MLIIEEPKIRQILLDVCGEIRKVAAENPQKKLYKELTTPLLQ